MKKPKEKENYIVVLASCKKGSCNKIGKVIRSFSTNAIASLKAAAASTTFGDENT
jgi:hypothetical protein